MTEFENTLEAVEEETTEEETTEEETTEEETAKKNPPIRMEVVAPVGELTEDEAAAALQCSPLNVKKFRQFGLLKGIKTGRAWRYSQKAIDDFQKRFEGMDISGSRQMALAAQKVNGNR